MPSHCEANVATAHRADCDGSWHTRTCCIFWRLLNWLSLHSWHGFCAAATSSSHRGVFVYKQQVVRGPALAMHGVLVLFRTPLQWAGGRKPSVELSTGHATWHTQLGCSATPPKRVQRWGPPMLSMFPMPLLLLFAVASQQQQTNKQSQTNSNKRMNNQQTTNNRP